MSEMVDMPDVLQIVWCGGPCGCLNVGQGEGETYTRGDWVDDNIEVGIRLSEMLRQYDLVDEDPLALGLDLAADLAECGLRMVQLRRTPIEEVRRAAR